MPIDRPKAGKCRRARIAFPGLAARITLTKQQGTLKARCFNFTISSEQTRASQDRRKLRSCSGKTATASVTEILDHDSEFVPIIRLAQVAKLVPKSALRSGPPHDSRGAIQLGKVSA